MKKLLIIGFIGCLFTPLFAQQHSEQNHSKYVVPTDPSVQTKLKTWSNNKFGLLMHWGTYSQWGIVESWSLCPEDEGWCERRGPYKENWYEYKKAIPKGFVRIQAKIAECTDAGIPVHYFIGNHDMWTFGYLEQELGVILHKEPIIIERNNKYEQ